MKEENDGRISFELWCLRIAFRAKRRNEMHIATAHKTEYWRRLYHDGFNSDKAYDRAKRDYIALSN